MSQRTLGTEFAIVEFKDGSPTKEGLKELFFDLDYTENEEYFRADTKDLGFESEADRLVDEISKKGNLSGIEKIEECVNSQTKDAFYVDSEIHTTTIDVNGVIDGCGTIAKVIVSVAYMSET